MSWSALTTSTPPPIKRVFQDRKGTRKVCSLMASLEQEATNRALVRWEEGLGGGCRLRLRLFKYLGHFFFLLVFVAPPEAHPKECGGRQRPSSKECDCFSFYLYRVFDKKVILSPFTGVGRGVTETRSI